MDIFFPFSPVVLLTATNRGNVFSRSLQKCFGRVFVCLHADLNISVLERWVRSVFSAVPKYRPDIRMLSSSLPVVCWISVPGFLLPHIRRKYPTEPCTESGQIKKIGWKMLLHACKILSHKHKCVWHSHLGESYDCLLVHYIKSLVHVSRLQRALHLTIGVIFRNFRVWSSVLRASASSLKVPLYPFFLGRSTDLQHDLVSGILWRINWSSLMLMLWFHSAWTHKGSTYWVSYQTKVLHRTLKSSSWIVVF